MNVDFIIESDDDLKTRKNLYINPDCELSQTLSNIQESLDDNGFSIDLSEYKYVGGKLSKFNIELISSPDLTLLLKRMNSVKKLKINITKSKWEHRGDEYVLKIGKIQDKDLYISVASFNEPVDDSQYEKIKEIREKVIKDKFENIKVVEENSVRTSDEIVISNPVVPVVIPPPTPVVPIPVPVHVPVVPVPVVPVPIHPVLNSTSDVQNRHNMSIRRSGFNNSTIRPVPSSVPRVTPFPSIPIVTPISRPIINQQIPKPVPQSVSSSQPSIPLPVKSSTSKPTTKNEKYSGFFKIRG